MQKKSTSHYKNGIKNGFKNEWNEDEKIIFQGNFVKGNEK
jgi:antitoxin component YwqK of YwqJK toxin-antitoxin module